MPVRFALGLSIVAAFVGCGDRTPAVPVKLEFRFAQLEPADGFLEMDAAPGAESPKLYVAPEILVSNADVAWARMTKANGAPAIELSFARPSQARILEFSEKNIGRKLAMIVDGEIVAAPTIRDRFGSEALLTGDFTLEEAQRIARGIKAK